MSQVAKTLVVVAVGISTLLTYANTKATAEHTHGCKLENMNFREVCNGRRNKKSFMHDIDISVQKIYLRIQGEKSNFDSTCSYLQTQAYKQFTIYKPHSSIIQITAPTFATFSSNTLTCNLHHVPLQWPLKLCLWQEAKSQISRNQDQGRLSTHHHHRE